MHWRSVVLGVELALLVVLYGVLLVLARDLI